MNFNITTEIRLPNTIIFHHFLLILPLATSPNQWVFCGLNNIHNFTSCHYSINMILTHFATLVKLDIVFLPVYCNTFVQVTPASRGSEAPKTSFLLQVPSMQWRCTYSMQALNVLHMRYKCQSFLHHLLVFCGCRNHNSHL